MSEKKGIVLPGERVPVVAGPCSLVVLSTSRIAPRCLRYSGVNRP